MYVFVSIINMYLRPNSNLLDLVSLPFFVYFTGEGVAATAEAVHAEAEEGGRDERHPPQGGDDYRRRADHGPEKVLPRHLRAQPLRAQQGENDPLIYTYYFLSTGMRYCARIVTSALDAKSTSLKVYFPDRRQLKHHRGPLVWKDTPGAVTQGQHENTNKHILRYVQLKPVC